MYSRHTFELRCGDNESRDELREQGMWQSKQAVSAEEEREEVDKETIVC